MRPDLLSPARLRLLAALHQAGKPVKVRDLTAMVGRSSFGQTCQHIHRLAAVGLVEVTPAGYCFVKVPDGMAVLASGVLARVVWSDLAEGKAA